VCVHYDDSTIVDSSCVSDTTGLPVWPDDDRPLLPMPVRCGTLLNG
jgi:hypothetical protein